MADLQQGVAGQSAGGALGGCTWLSRSSRASRQLPRPQVAMSPGLDAIPRAQTSFDFDLERRLLAEEPRSSAQAAEQSSKVCDELCLFFPTPVARSAAAATAKRPAETVTARLCCPLHGICSMSLPFSDAAHRRAPPGIGPCQDVLNPALARCYFCPH